MKNFWLWVGMGMVAFCLMCQQITISTLRQSNELQAAHIKTLQIQERRARINRGDWGKFILGHQDEFIKWEHRWSILVDLMDDMRDTLGKLNGDIPTDEPREFRIEMR